MCDIQSLCGRDLAEYLIMLLARSVPHEHACCKFNYRAQNRYQLSWRVRIGCFLPDRTQAWLHMDSPSSWLVTTFFTVVSATFGMIHCLGRNSHFLSSAEQILWRISALTVVVLPVALLVEVATFWHIVHPPPIVIQGGRYIYILAHISLFTLSFLALRDLPFAAYQTPSWVNFIPHL